MPSPTQKKTLLNSVGSKSLEKNGRHANYDQQVPSEGMGQDFNSSHTREFVLGGGHRVLRGEEEYISREVLVKKPVIDRNLNITLTSSQYP